MPGATHNVWLSYLIRIPSSDNDPWERTISVQRCVRISWCDQWSGLEIWWEITKEASPIESVRYGCLLIYWEKLEQIYRGKSYPRCIVSVEWNWVKYENHSLGESLVFLTSCVISPHTIHQTRFLHLFHCIIQTRFSKVVADEYDKDTAVCATKFWKCSKPLNNHFNAACDFKQTRSQWVKVSPYSDKRSCILESGIFLSLKSSIIRCSSRQWSDFF